MLKREIRILGFDDAPFDKFNDKEVLVVGTFFRGGEWMDGVLSTAVAVDGDDATPKLIELVNRSKFSKHTQCILIDGIAFGGFNIINIESVWKHTGKPVIVVVRRMPDFDKIKETLQKLGMEKKYQLIEKAGKPIPVQVHEGKIFIQFVGISEEKAKNIIQLTATRSYLPEPIRVAHLIAAGIVEGESKGNA